jgi:hypothetical protein
MKKFVYEQRSVEDVEKRVSNGSKFDRSLKDFVKMFKPVTGKNRVRILPPTWKDPTHYGYDVWSVYNVGPDNQNYLSLSKMGKGKDPVFEEYQKAKSEGREDDAKNLAARRRVMVYVIDRKHEDEGPQVWFMPIGIDKDICAISVDEDTGALINVDSPEDGYDVTFTKEGDKLMTKYTGVAIARTSSPISTNDKLYDEWLDYIVEHPLPSLLNFYSYEHIKAVLNGEDTSNEKPVADDDFDPETGEVLESKDSEEDGEPPFEAEEKPVVKSVRKPAPISEEPVCRDDEEVAPAQSLRARMESRRKRNS